MRSRQFSIVVHNVALGSEVYWTTTTNTMTPTRLVLSIEEYPNSPGHYHIHVFIQFKNARTLISIISAFDKFKIGHIIPAPIADKVSGRVQVDPMKGSFDQATAYLTAGKSKKDDKLFGNVISSQKDHYNCIVCKQSHHWAFTKYQFIGSKDCLCNKCEDFFDANLELYNIVNNSSLDPRAYYLKFKSSIILNGLYAFNVNA